jgi:Flp pilus assembly protein TadB
MTAATMVAIAAGCLAGLHLLPVVRVRQRLGRVTGAHHRLTRGSASSARPAAPAVRSRLSRLVADPRRPVAVLLGVAVALFVGGWTGVGCGVVAVVVAERGLRRLESPAVRAERAACQDDLPLAADLLAAALRSGAPVDRAVTAVADALGGPLGARLASTASSLRLGGAPAEAWAHLAGVPGAARLVAAAVRSSSSGVALAGALGRLSEDLRADRAVAAEASARRAGVLVVLPLGLCFLPAFVLAGLVPVIVAVLGGVF